MAARKRRRRRRTPMKRTERKPKQPRGRFIDDDEFGRIPLVPREITRPDGTVERYFDYDPDYRPPLPAGAVRGDIRRQAYCCGGPRYYYKDIPRVCVQCGIDFTFRAREQKHWFETLGFNRWSTAIRCLDCRRRQRSDKALGQALAAAVEQARAEPGDAGAQLALAEATVAHVERFGTGDLDRALAAVRRARRTESRLEASLYWEGRCHELARRPARAREAFAAFLDVAAERGSLRKLVRDAKARS